MHSIQPYVYFCQFWSNSTSDYTITVLSALLNFSLNFLRLNEVRKKSIGLIIIDIVPTFFCKNAKKVLFFAQKSRHISDLQKLFSLTFFFTKSPTEFCKTFFVGITFRGRHRLGQIPDRDRIPYITAANRN